MKWTFSEAAGALYIAWVAVQVLRWFAGFSWETQVRSVSLILVLCTSVAGLLASQRMPESYSPLALLAVFGVATLLTKLADFVALRPPNKLAEHDADNQDHREDVVREEAEG